VPEVEFFLRQAVNGIILGSTYSLVALGLTLVFGVLRVINLAQGELFMAGAFAGLLCLNAGAPLAVVLVGGLASAGLLGIAMYWLALRPLPASADPHIPMISTIGAAIIIQQVATRLFSARQQAYPTPESLGGRVEVGILHLDILSLFILALALVIMLALIGLIRHTRLGMAIRAVAENGRVAGLLGINRSRTIAIVFVISSSLAGIAGVLVGMYFNNVSPYIGIPVGLKGLAAVILGGLGSVPGAVLAGFIIGVAEVMSVAYVASSWRDAIAFLVMILILLLRPNGLFGKPAIERV
jgi:branched-chain amino acid transport system permease protein